MSRRKKREDLSSGELRALLVACEGLHKAICRPVISPQGEHYKSLQRLHAAMLVSVRELTGHDIAPWESFGTTTPSRWAQGRDL